MPNGIPRRVSGFDLQSRRRRAGLTQQDVAGFLRVSRRRVSAIEGARRPTPEAVARYVLALEFLARESA